MLVPLRARCRRTAVSNYACKCLQLRLGGSADQDRKIIGAEKANPKETSAPVTERTTPHTVRLGLDAREITGLPTARRLL